MDESALTQEPYLCKSWTQKGTQAQVPAAAGTPWIQHIFGGLNVMDGTLCYTLADARNSDSFVAWLEQLMTVSYPTQNVCVVLDNASFHRSGLSQAAVSLFEPRLQLFFLPPYSPQLNPIEPYWGVLKRKVQGNHLHTSPALLTERLHTELKRQNDLTNPDRFYVYH